MGEVWLAKDQTLGRDVAIKFIKSDRLGQQTSERFLREARSAAQIRHPNVMTIHHVMAQDGQMRIVMEYLPRSLEDELHEKGPLGWREATSAVRDAAAGLAAAHGLGIIHRDVKPSNLMRGPGGEVKLVDFGVCKISDSVIEQTRTGQIIGSPAYMSPEQCRGAKADARSDIYSLACTYYALLTGKMPFTSESCLQVMQHHCKEPFPDAGRLVVGLPASVRQILIKASQKNPQDRFQSARELHQAADAALVNPSSGASYKTSRRVGRSVALVAAICAIFFPAMRWRVRSVILHSPAPAAVAAAPVAEAAVLPPLQKNPTVQVAAEPAAFRISPATPIATTQKSIAALPAPSKSNDSPPSHISDGFAIISDELRNIVANERAQASIAQQRTARIRQLMDRANANDSHENGQVALAALDDLLTMDPTNNQARQLKAKIAEYYDPSRLGDIWLNSAGMKFAYIPPGEFTMGSPDDEALRYDDETQHRVRITRPFLIGLTAVTVRQFAAFVKATGYKTDAEQTGWAYAWSPRGWVRADGASWTNPSFPQTDNCPVVDVSFNDALRFCRWLAGKEHYTYRLPTEAEWEYCCRAGSAAAFPWGDNPDDGHGWANCADQDLRASQKSLQFPPFNWSDGYVYTSPVGVFKANSWGLYDMIGNALQWCSDCYDTYNGEAVDPTGPSHGQGRVLRGGSWECGPQRCRSACRFCFAPDWKLNIAGFRVVRDLN
jgi:formylglycine-generating enzyme required for sulfatase activity